MGKGIEDYGSTPKNKDIKSAFRLVTLIAQRERCMTQRKEANTEKCDNEILDYCHSPGIHGIRCVDQFLLCRLLMVKDVE